MAGPADAADAIWLGGTAANDYGTAANWSPTGPPTDTAVFGASANTSVTLASNVTLGGWTFNAGAIAYSFAGSGRSIFFTGAGTLTDGNAVNITSDANLNFRNTSTAGDSTVTMVATGSVAFLNSSSAGSANLTFNILGSFTGTSTAGSAVITNNSPSTLSFVGTSTAGSAAISNSGTVRFASNGTAANAVITNRAGGVVTFAANGNGGNAAFVNVDTATVDFSQSSFNANRLTAGSLAGGGVFSLGQNQLTVGSNNQSTTVTGVIADGGIGLGTGGSLVKAGTGTMTLSGANSYSGGTIVTAGTLATGTVALGRFASLGTGPVTMAGGTLRTTANGALTNDVVFATGTTSVLAAATGTTMLIGGPASNFSLDAGATAVFGSTTDTGTILFSGVLPFPAGPLPVIHPGSAVVVAGGTLQVNQINLYRMLGFTGSVTVDAGATIDMSGSVLEIINNLGGAGTVVTGAAAATPLLLTSFPNRTNLFAGTITGDRAVQTDGDYTFSGINSYTGGTIICSCGTLRLGDGGTTGSILGNVQNDGTLVFNRSDSYGFAGIISGTGALVQAGTGVTDLTGINSYSGATMVNAGTLSVNGSIADLVADHGQCRRHARRHRHRRQHRDQWRHAGARQFDRHAQRAGQSGLHRGLELHGRGVADQRRPHQCQRHRDARRRHGERELRARQLCRRSNTPSSTPPAASSAASAALVNTNLPSSFKSSLSYDANNAYLNLALDFTPTPRPHRRRATAASTATRPMSPMR